MRLIDFLRRGAAGIGDLSNADGNLLLDGVALFLDGVEFFLNVN